MKEKRITLTIYSRKVEGRQCATHGGFWGDEYKRCGWHKAKPELSCKPVMEDVK